MKSLNNFLFFGSLLILLQTNTHNVFADNTSRTKYQTRKDPSRILIKTLDDELQKSHQFLNFDELATILQKLSVIQKLNTKQINDLLVDIFKSSSSEKVITGIQDFFIRIGLLVFLLQTNKKYSVNPCIDNSCTNEQAKKDPSRAFVYNTPAEDEDELQKSHKPIDYTEVVDILERLSIVQNWGAKQINDWLAGIFSSLDGKRVAEIQTSFREKGITQGNSLFGIEEYDSELGLSPLEQTMLQKALREMKLISSSNYDDESNSIL